MEDVGMNGRESSFIICDASVLIDYMKAEPKILLLASKRVGRLHVPTQILDEVDQLNSTTAKKYGITIIESELSQIAEAGVRGGPLSRSDKLVFIMARDMGYTCWTSDRCLRERCIQEGISVLWGLEIMLILFKKRHLQKAVALRTARHIKASGSFITDKVLLDFETEIIRLEKNGT